MKKINDEIIKQANLAGSYIGVAAFFLLLYVNWKIAILVLIMLWANNMTMQR